MEITKDIKYVGVDDRKVDLFEGQYPVPNGISYNSYVIMDQKTAVIKAAFFALVGTNSPMTTPTANKQNLIIAKSFQSDCCKYSFAIENR